MNPTIMHFVLSRNNTDVKTIMARFRPIRLNKTEWRGKPPRSCGLRNVRFGSAEPAIIRIEVEYRPKGCITFIGQTRFDQWTAMPIAQRPDGTFVDANGEQLAEGKSPVYVPREVFEDIEFNDLDFGELVREEERPDVKRTTFDEVWKRFLDGGSINNHVFVAPHRSRPFRKIVISNNPSQTYIDGFGVVIITLSQSEPQLDALIPERLTELVFDFIEGRASLFKAETANPNEVLVDLSDVLVDQTPCDVGQEPWFSVFDNYTPIGFLTDLAKKLMSIYDLEIEVLEGDGRQRGFYIRRTNTTR